MGNVIYWRLPYQSPTSGGAVEQNLGREPKRSKSLSEFQGNEGSSTLGRTVIDVSFSFDRLLFNLSGISGELFEHFESAVDSLIKYARLTAMTNLCRCHFTAARWEPLCSGVRRSGSFFVAVSLTVPDQFNSALRKCVNRRGSPCEPLTQAVEEKHRGGFVVNRSKQRAGSPTKLSLRWALNRQRDAHAQLLHFALIHVGMMQGTSSSHCPTRYVVFQLYILFKSPLRIRIYIVNAHIHSGVCGFSSALNLIETFLPWMLTFRRKF